MQEKHSNTAYQEKIRKNLQEILQISRMSRNKRKNFKKNKNTAVILRLKKR